MFYIKVQEIALIYGCIIKVQSNTEIEIWRN